MSLTWPGEGLCPWYHAGAWIYAARKYASSPTIALVFVDIFEAYSEARQCKSLNAIQSHSHSIQQEEWTHAENQGHVELKTGLSYWWRENVRKIPRYRLERW
jgi:hypothetical protein